MAEYKLFEGEIPYVSTREFHADRERAPHLEQPGHRERLIIAAALIGRAAGENETWEKAFRASMLEATRPAGYGFLPTPSKTFSDLGCGDGGLLSLVQGWFTWAWGYDFCPANAAGWKERHVSAVPADVFGTGKTDGGTPVSIGSVVAMTEVLEHLADPRAALRWVRGEADFLVCSSPFTETDKDHCAEHAWAWDIEGYKDLLTDGGWNPVRHETTNMFQVVLAKRAR